MLELTRRTLKRAAVHVYIVISFPLAFAAPTDKPTILGSYDVNINETSVSGISSGADMAVQFAIAHSSYVKGVGAIAGSPYYCAQGSVIKVSGSCMIGPVPDVNDLKAATKRFAKDGLIDKTSKLRTQKVWLFTGYNDGIVKSPLVKALFDFYRGFTDSGNIYFKEDLPAAHAMLTTWSDAKNCDYTGDKFMNKCKGDDPSGYDAAGLILQHIYGKLNDRNHGALSSEVMPFQQSKFFSGAISMADIGYVYVPKSCQDQEQERCRVHIVFHGCEQGATVEEVGFAFITHAGYNEWADTNHIIVLYPQVVVGNYPYNPLGCWDWWGYTGSNYAQKDGRQIVVIEKMLNRLAQKPEGWKSAPTEAPGPPLSLKAMDSSPSRVALAWTPVAGADGYNVYRLKVSGEECPKESLPENSKVNRKIVLGNSYSDSGLSQDTRYCYQVKAVHATTVSKGSEIVQRQTTHNPPDCDPYFRSVMSHVLEGRAHPSWLALGQLSYANGSNQYLGSTYSTEDWVLLTQTSPGYFVKDQPCKAAP